MNGSMRLHSAQQSGAALIICLLILLVLTILGVVMMQTTRMQEHMAGNTRDLNLALQGAETSLRAAEANLAALTARPDPSTTASSCATWPSICDLGILPVAVYDPTQFNFRTKGTAYAQPVSELKEVPRYAVEDLGLARDTPGVGPDYSVDGREFYQISGWSSGGTGTPYTVLQSTYARRF